MIWPSWLGATITTGNEVEINAPRLEFNLGCLLHSFCVWLIGPVEKQWTGNTLRKKSGLEVSVQFAHWNLYLKPEAVIPVDSIFHL